MDTAVPWPIQQLLAVLCVFLLCQEGQTHFPGLSCVETEDKKMPPRSSGVGLWLGHVLMRVPHAAMLCTQQFPWAQLANPRLSL